MTEALLMTIPQNQNILRERVVGATRLEVRRHTFDEAGSGAWAFEQGVLELCLSGRKVGGEVYFQGVGGDVGGTVGELVYFPQSMPFKGRWTRGTETNFACHLSSELSSQLRELSDDGLEQAVSIKSPALLSTMNRMLHELEHYDAHSDAILEGLCQQISGLLSRHLEMLLDTAPRRSDVAVSSLPFRAILEELNGRRGMPTLQMLAERLSYSEKYFGRLFQKATGHRFSELIVRRKMEVAKELLASDRMAIKEIAYEVGYDVAADFSRAFKANVGLSPSEYRARYHEGLS